MRPESQGEGNQGLAPVSGESRFSCNTHENQPMSNGCAEQWMGKPMEKPFRGSGAIQLDTFLPHVPAAWHRCPHAASPLTMDSCPGDFTVQFVPRCSCFSVQRQLGLLCSPGTTSHMERSTTQRHQVADQSIASGHHHPGREDLLTETLSTGKGLPPPPHKSRCFRKKRLAFSLCKKLHLNSHNDSKIYFQFIVFKWLKEII